MIYKDLVTNLIRSWNFVRSETLEILDSLDDKKLQFKPSGEKWQPLYHQFGCIGRTQLVYTKAIQEGKMDFSWFSSPDLPKKDQFETKEDIKKFLQQTDRTWTLNIRQKRDKENFKIKWPGVNQPLIVQISSLVAHERIHHGQFISYFTLAGFELPKGFKSNWAL